MIRSHINDLQPGMLVAASVYSRNGLLLIPKHTVLSTQQIAHLAFYRINEVYVFPEEELTDSDIEELINDGGSGPLTYSQQVNESREFQNFKVNYLEKVGFFNGYLNDIITRNKPARQKQLLSHVAPLYNESATTLSMFDMLHNMRHIDDSTYAHSINVSLISRMLGKWLHFSEEALDILTLSGLFHDVGKCRVAPAIIQKPGRLTQEEFNEIKKHPRLGYDILKDLHLDAHVKYSALMHHERNDGSGYPLGLKDNQINSFAQIISIADVYDAMTANRCYRKGLCPFEVIATFEQEGLDKYNPKYILTFLEHVTDSYMNNTVLLNDGRQGKIILINRRMLSRPVVEVSNDTFIDLSEHWELFIEAII